ncbi:hypothetical protein HYH02_014927 [Chlamydomonas schloesseri]|uniref:Uncharacterized protein n=1 Tax=Chlamydomonas schloesseri TaxID=2026947 RepID=A0A835VU22_9CHLO|nr:hypothetical protein HYH02_014927 [Chlamydomonas schloesseri]|eukprot:KAG2425863.1 hypothetical protein HYH02_014927 [Chlamydomonas schloesseri]
MASIVSSSLNLSTCAKQASANKSKSFLLPAKCGISARPGPVGIRQSRQPVECKAAAAAATKPCCKAAAAAAAAAAPSLPEGVILTVVAGAAYTALSIVLMALFPRKTAGFFSSVWPFVPLAAAYVVLLVGSWSPDTLSIMMPGSLEEGLKGGFNPQFLPKLEGIASLFGRLPVTASWVLHIMCVNLFSARWCLLDGLRNGVPTAHSLLLGAVFGPLGLLSHYLTKALTRVVPSLKTDQQPVTLKSETGSITILPYSE